MRQIKQGRKACPEDRLMWKGPESLLVGEKVVQGSFAPPAPSQMKRNFRFVNSRRQSNRDPGGRSGQPTPDQSFSPHLLFCPTCEYHLAVSRDGKRWEGGCLTTADPFVKCHRVSQPFW
jgi:hypothetical protein